MLNTKNRYELQKETHHVIDPSVSPNITDNQFDLTHCHVTSFKAPSKREHET